MDNRRRLCLPIPLERPLLESPLLVPPKLQGKPEYNSSRVFIKEKVFHSFSPFQTRLLHPSSIALPRVIKYFLVRSNAYRDNTRPIILTRLEEMEATKGRDWRGTETGRELEFYGSPNELKRNEAAIDLFAPPIYALAPPACRRRRLDASKFRADKEFASWLKIEMLQRTSNDFYNRTRDNITENGTIASGTQQTRTIHRIIVPRGRGI